MRLVRYVATPTARIDAFVDGGVADLGGGDLPSDIVELIALGDAGIERASELAEAAAPVPLDEITLLAPLPSPPKDVMCVGRNYGADAAEFSRSGFDASERAEVPEHPVIFTKATTSIVGPGEAIVAANDPTGTTDYEGELAVVIGPGGRRIASGDALGHVFGYTIVNDVTARDLQKRHVQWFLGKSPDTFCPMGPAIVTADELPGIATAWLRTRVNGELRQEAQIADLIFDIPTLIRTISQVVTLEPGDVIATGTPVGAGLGFDPPRFLRPGDRVEVSIDGIGTLVNPVA
jgi:2-keto-4-pentenoate hydratase/2-oxohepta-3-ene-1,7-dioic acid hydratase in catechol pathway